MLELDGIADEILSDLKEHSAEILLNCSLSSPRSVGDAVQEYLANYGLKRVLKSYGIDINTEFGRRSMEDMAFKDADDNYYAVDVKTHNLDTDFNMPNLISVKRLATFYANDDKNYFCILIVSYHTDSNELTFTGCDFKPIESFDWGCLTLGALGWGQIQIANANKIIFTPVASRKTWMLKLCDKLAAFYDAEISKIGVRKTWLQQQRKAWEIK